jgi:sugar/nucleoside kinase (ribokinase family)
VALKPNRHECIRAASRDGSEDTLWRQAAIWLAQRIRKPVFCTAGEEGILLADPQEGPRLLPAYRVSGPIDPVGAGDSTSAAITCAVAAGADLPAAAAFGNLVASITVQQLGTTGTATPQQVRARWSQVR